MPQPIESSEASKNKRLDIQGLRALAVVLVLCFHLGLPVSGGFIGVDVFFVISGFVITSMLEREWLANGHIRISRFFVRRFWRLTPALATVVSVTMIFGAAILSAYGPQRLMILTGTGAMLLGANAVIAKTTGGYFDTAADTNPLLNTWSLSVEEQFYIGFLLVLIIGWALGRRLPRPRVVVVTFVLALFADSLAMAMFAQPGHALDQPNWLFHFYSPLNRAWEFAAGSLLALFAWKLSEIPMRIRNIAGIVGLGLISYSAFFIAEGPAWPGLWTVIPIVGTCLLICASAEKTSNLYRILGSRFAVYLGDRSYSLYLWHWPVIVILSYCQISRLTQIVLALMVTAVLTIATFRWIETPLRHRRHSSKSAATLLALIIFGTPLVFAQVVNVALEHKYWNGNIKSQAKATGRFPITHRHGCEHRISRLNRAESDCAWNLAARGTPIYFLGDSNAAQYSDGLIIAAKQTGHPLTTAIALGCPFLVTPYKQPDRDPMYSGCSKVSTETHTWLRRQPRGLVVISNTDLYALVPTFRVIRSSQPGSVGANQYLSLFEKTVHTLAREGFKVAVISSPPHFDRRIPTLPSKYYWDLERCDLSSELANNCKKSMPIAVADMVQKDYRAALSELTSQPGVALVDVSRAFCSKTECPTQIPGLQIYRDGGHTTVAAAVALIPKFVETIKQMTPGH